MRDFGIFSPRSNGSASSFPSNVSPDSFQSIDRGRKAGVNGVSFVVYVILFWPVKHVYFWKVFRFDLKDFQIAYKKRFSVNSGITSLVLR